MSSIDFGAIFEPARTQLYVHPLRLGTFPVFSTQRKALLDSFEFLVGSTVRSTKNLVFT